jgi:predicted nuclease of predicted toxin-antitoxin system
MRIFPPKWLRFFETPVLMCLMSKREQNWYGQNDEVLLDIAYQDQRFVLTHDSDFGTLAVNKGKPFYGILYFRLKNLKSTNVIRICDRVIRKDLDVYPGTILIIEESRIRIRHPSSEE